MSENRIDKLNESGVDIMSEGRGGIGDPLTRMLENPAATYESTSGDYKAFYALNDNPFADSVNPAFFYRTDAHSKALEQMMTAIEQDVSLGMITGLSGTGKTLLTQLILQNLDPARYVPILVLVSPGLSKTGLLREILSELDVALPAGINRTQELIKLLSNRIIDMYHGGQKLVIIIDECHFLTSDNLHIVRTISNIEVPERKLTTCLLFGEARFAQRLKNPNYASIRSRMYMQGELLPMGADDCAQYIKFRLMAAGGSDELFDETALEAVHAHTHGVSRCVNKLCMLSLLEGFARRIHVIDEDTVNRCAARS